MSPALAQLTGARKSAILCLALGPEGAAKILEQLSPEELRAVSREIATLPKVEDSVVRDVLLDVQAKTAGSGPGRVEGGLTVAESLLSKALGESRAGEIVRDINPVAASKLSDLQRMEPRTFASILLDEHPQTIAAILAHLEVRAAANALSELPRGLASDVLIRMAQMEKITPDMLSVLERGLRSKTDFSFSGVSAAPGGPGAVAKLLHMAAGPLGEELLEKIDEKNGDLAARIKSMMLIFEDILLVDGKGVQKILREVDNKELALALKGASAELKKLIRANMSERAGEALEEEIELLGAVRVKDVEEAQQRIMEEVRRLEEAGEIVVRREGGDDEFIT